MRTLGVLTAEPLDGLFDLDPVGPESYEVYHAYLGEFFWAPSVSADYDREGWETNDKTPCPVRVTSAGCLWEKGHDKSVEVVVRIALPARWIWQAMKLHWRGVEGRFFDEGGNVVCFDPSVRKEGPNALLFKRDALVNFLDKQEVRTRMDHFRRETNPFSDRRFPWLGGNKRCL